jgi:hypothetical protein
MRQNIIIGLLVVVVGLLACLNYQKYTSDQARVIEALYAPYDPKHDLWSK